MKKIKKKVCLVFYFSFSNPKLQRIADQRIVEVKQDKQIDELYLLVMVKLENVSTKSTRKNDNYIICVFDNFRLYFFNKTLSSSS